jgi:hypothetical protein
MNLNYATIAGATFLLLSACAGIDKPDGTASATLTIEGSLASYYAGAASGEGTLSYQGQQYPFTLSAVGGGGSAAETISATGQVYNLNALEDFPGKYTSKRKGITIGKGEFTALLKSDRGVQIYLEGETTGMGSSMGMSSVTIELK